MKISVRLSIYLLSLIMFSLHYNSNARKHSYIGEITANIFIDRNVIDGSQLSLIFKNRIQKKNTLNIICHGKSGSLFINNQWLSGVELINQIKKIAHAQPHKVKQINIYACEFGKGKKGKYAITNLEHTLDVSIAASDDITGRNGDWDLEVGSGSFKESNKIEYNYNLQTCSGLVGGLLSNDDYDGDGVCNSIDFDDDNDGIVDNQEDSCAGVINTIQTTHVSIYNPDYPLTTTDIGLLSDNSGTTRYIGTTKDTLTIADFRFPATKNVSNIRIYHGDGTAGTNSKFIKYINVIYIYNGAAQLLGTINNIILDTPKTFNHFQDIPLGATYDDVAFLHIGDLASSSAGIGFGGIWLRGCAIDDKDKDGIANSFDLDSDNDGCPDATESNSPYKYNQLDAGGRVKAAIFYNASNLSDNRTGVPGSARKSPGTSQNASIQNIECNPCNSQSSLFTDKDGDTIGDYCDLDDDNDGILDANEETCSSAALISFDTAGRDLTNTTIATNVPGLTAKTTVSGNYSSWKTENEGSEVAIVGRNGTDYTNPLTMSYKFNMPVRNLGFSARDYDLQFGGTERGTITAYYKGTIVWPVIDSTVFEPNTVQSYYNKFGGITKNDLHASYDNGVKLSYGPQMVDSLVVTQEHSNNTVAQGILYKFEYGCAADYDKDGIPDIFDLDSDNDGCQDAREGGSQLSASYLVPSGGTASVGTSTASNSNLCAALSCVNPTTGVPNATPSGQSVNYSTNELVNVCNIPLPLNNINLHLSSTDCNNTLIWNALKNNKIQSYEIQHSTNGAIFYQLTKYTADKNNAAYTYTHKATNDGFNYYRLKVTNNANEDVFSNVVASKQDCSNKTQTLYPNPANNHININGLKTGEIIKIYDCFGKEVYNGVSSKSIESINISQFISGNYQLLIICNDGSLVSKPFIKL